MLVRRSKGGNREHGVPFAAYYSAEIGRQAR
jgi:hypothetical protein